MEQRNGAAQWSSAMELLRVLQTLHCPLYIPHHSTRDMLPHPPPSISHIPSPSTPHLLLICPDQFLVHSVLELARTTGTRQPTVEYYQLAITSTRLREGGTMGCDTNMYVHVCIGPRCLVLTTPTTNPPPLTLRASSPAFRAGPRHDTGFLCPMNIPGSWEKRLETRGWMDKDGSLCARFGPWGH